MLKLIPHYREAARWKILCMGYFIMITRVFGYRVTASGDSGPVFQASLLPDVLVFSVIPAKAEIQGVSVSAWIALKLHFVPGSPLRYARNDESRQLSDFKRHSGGGRNPG